MSFDSTWWISFTLGVVLLIFIDLMMIQAPKKKMTTAKACVMTSIWVGLALLFSLFLHITKGPTKALEYMTGYLIELSLSVDNLFVFLIIFQYFHVPNHLRGKILTWGILGALLMRFTFIFAGIALIEKAHWMLYVFGIFLVATGVMLLRKQEGGYDPSKNWAVRILKRIMPLSDSWDTQHFFTKSNGKLLATPLFVTLVAIESSDLLFALDSIPAVFAITLDPFIVFSCNAMAIIGLRSLFFVLQNLASLFHFLHHGVCILLIFVGLKMTLGGIYTIPTPVSLGIIGTIIAISLILSRIFPQKESR